MSCLDVPALGAETGKLWKTFNKSFPPNPAIPKLYITTSSQQNPLQIQRFSPIVFMLSYSFTD